MWLKTESFFKPHSALPFYCCQFDHSCFTPAEFIHTGVVLPAKIENAIPKRQAEYLAGRICARETLMLNGINNFQVSSSEDRAPIWPDNIQASITHKQDIAAAMASNNPKILGLGIDIEYLMKETQEIKLQSHILAPDEHSSFKNLAKHHSHPLTIVFSAKESIYKALYPLVKTYFGFDAVTLREFNACSLVFSTNRQLADSLPKGLAITVYYQQYNDLVLTECIFD